MLKRKKLNQIRRERRAKCDAVANLKAQKERDRELRERRIRLKEYRENHKEVFWQEYYQSLREDRQVGSGNKRLEATPCTKPRSVISPY